MFVDEEYQSAIYIDYYEEDDYYGEEKGFSINLKVYEEKAQESLNGKYVSSTVSFDGKQSAEEAASLIQNRASVLVSERQ